MDAQRQLKLPGMRQHDTKALRALHLDRRGQCDVFMSVLHVKTGPRGILVSEEPRTA